MLIGVKVGEVMRLLSIDKLPLPFIFVTLQLIVSLPFDGEILEVRLKS